MEKSLLPNDFNWHNSVDHLDVLRQFIVCEKKYKVGRIHFDNLGETTIQAINRLITDGAIVSASLDAKLNAVFRKSDLDLHLRSLGIKPKAAKKDVINQLILEDIEWVKKQTDKHNFYICSDFGRSILQKLDENKLEEVRKTELSIYNAILKGKYKDIKPLYKKYRLANSQFCNEYHIQQLEEKIETIMHIMDYLPSNLKKLYDEHDLRYIQSVMAMKKIVEEKPIDYWLPENFSIEAEKIVKIIELITRYQDYINIMFENIENDWFNLRFENLLDGESTCESCKKLDGIFIDHMHIPDWPIEGCTNEKGCVPYSDWAQNFTDFNDEESNYDADEEEIDRQLTLQIERRRADYRVQINQETGEYFNAFRKLSSNTQTSKMSYDEFVKWTNKWLSKPIQQKNK